MLAVKPTNQGIFPKSSVKQALIDFFLLKSLANQNFVGLSNTPRFIKLIISPDNSSGL
tara:strand:- start:2153 stop:2326 length:174 start_codon:yes stop_codon:yes gene_type:complete